MQYDPALSGEAFLQSVTEHAAKADLFQLQRPASGDDDAPILHVDRAVDEFFTKANRAIESATGRAVNLKEIFSFGVFVYSVLFVDKAIAAAQWLSWVQFALSTYLELHSAEPIDEVNHSMKALRAELEELREELRTTFENQKSTK